jgi:hypothetical protein
MNNEPTFTLSEVDKILCNLGTDTTCGACMSIAFTGYAPGLKHTCPQPSVEGVAGEKPLRSFIQQEKHPLQSLLSEYSSLSGDVLAVDYRERKVLGFRGSLDSLLLALTFVSECTNRSGMRDRREVTNDVEAIRDAIRHMKFRTVEGCLVEVCFTTIPFVWNRYVKEDKTQSG